MNHPGEIAALVDMVRPHVALVTTVAPVHLEHFENVEAIARAKAEIFSGIVKGGVAIVNRDIDTFPLLEAAAKASPAGYVLSFGANIAADAHLTKFDPEDSFSRVSARVLGQDVHFNLGAPGRHMAINALGVLLAARAVGLDFASIAASLADVAPPQGRGRARNALARPRRFHAALPADRRELQRQSGLDARGHRPSGRGDDFGARGGASPCSATCWSSGPSGPALHAALDDDLQRNRIDLVFAAGPLSRHLFDAVAPEKRGAWAETAAALEPLVAEALRPGDIVMVKGSNGSRLHALAAGLKNRYPAPETQKIEV